MGSWGQEPLGPAAQEQALTGGSQLSLLLMENSIGGLQESRQEGEEGEEFLTNPETSVSWKIPSLSSSIQFSQPLMKSFARAR